MAWQDAQPTQEEQACNLFESMEIRASTNVSIPPDMDTRHAHGSFSNDSQFHEEIGRLLGHLWTKFIA